MRHWRRSRSCRVPCITAISCRSRSAHVSHPTQAKVPETPKANPCGLVTSTHSKTHVLRLLRASASSAGNIRGPQHSTSIGEDVVIINITRGRNSGPRKLSQLKLHPVHPRFPFPKPQNLKPSTLTPYLLTPSTYPQQDSLNPLIDLCALYKGVSLRSQGMGACLLRSRPCPKV